MRIVRHVYRLYAADGDLLYIGCTSLFDQRMKKHRYTKAWWGDVASVTIEDYTDHESAFRAEAAAITAERPRYSVTPAETYRRAQEARRLKREQAA